MCEHIPKAIYPTTFYTASAHWLVQIQHDQKQTIVLYSLTFATPFKSVFSAEFPIFLSDTFCLFLFP